MNDNFNVCSEKSVIDIAFAGTTHIYLMHLLCFQVTIDNMNGHSVPNFDLTTSEGIKKWQEAIQFIFQTTRY
jgi:hypothetical protein